METPAEHQQLAFLVSAACHAYLSPLVWAETCGIAGPAANVCLEQSVLSALSQQLLLLVDDCERDCGYYHDQETFFNSRV